MEKEFVTYELALRIKQLGFDEPCFGLWNLNNGKHEVDIIGVCKYSKDFKYREVLAPTFSQAFRWFREKQFLIDVTSHNSDEYEFYIKWSFAYSFLSDIYKTYEEAELSCLEKLIEIVEEKNKV